MLAAIYKDRWQIELFFKAIKQNLHIDNNRGFGSIMQQQKKLFKSGGSFKTEFRDIPFHKMVEGLGGYGESVEKADELTAAMERAFASGLPACVNVKTKSVISPLIEGLADRRVRASIE